MKQIVLIVEIVTNYAFNPPFTSLTKETNRKINSWNVEKCPFNPHFTSLINETWTEEEDHFEYNNFQSSFYESNN